MHVCPLEITVVAAYAPLLGYLAVAAVRAVAPAIRMIRYFLDG